MRATPNPPGPHSPDDAAPGGPLRDWGAAVWLAAASAVLVGVDLGRRILASNDEARFALLGQAVLSSGEWLFPRINGAVYHNKPLLRRG